MARASSSHIELHLVKANYALQGSAWAYTATSTGALEQVDLLAAEREKFKEYDAKVLAGMPAYPAKITKTALTDLVETGGSGGRSVPKVLAALVRLRDDNLVTCKNRGWGVTQGGGK